MGEHGKVDISAPKVVALIGTLLALGEGINLLIAGIMAPDGVNILWGLAIIAIAVFLFLSIGLIESIKLDIPWHWAILLLFGVILILLYYLVGIIQLISGLLIVIASILELLAEKNKYSSSRIVGFIGAIFAIIEGAMAIMDESIIGYFWGIIGIFGAVILILAITNIIKKANIPYSWYLTLIIGWICFTFVQVYGFQVSGYVIMVAFLLMLMAF